MSINTRRHPRLLQQSHILHSLNNTILLLETLAQALVTQRLTHTITMHALNGHQNHIQSQHQLHQLQHLKVGAQRRTARRLMFRLYYSWALRSSSPLKFFI